MADSAHDKAKSNMRSLPVTATPEESQEQHEPSRDVKVVLRGMSRLSSATMPSESHSDTDFSIRCPPEHSVHTTLDKLGLVITGQTDEGVTAMERTSQTEWRYDGVIELWVSIVLHSGTWLMPRSKTTRNGRAHLCRTIQGF